MVLRCFAVLQCAEPKTAASVASVSASADIIWPEPERGDLHTHITLCESE